MNQTAGSSISTFTLRLVYENLKQLYDLVFVFEQLKISLSACYCVCHKTLTAGPP